MDIITKAKIQEERFIAHMIEHNTFKLFNI